MADTSVQSDELYVGYLPVPVRQRRFLRVAVPTILWIVCGLSFVWARSQHTPGDGVWEQLQPVTLRGTMVAKPYPILFTSDQGPVLLVEGGKHGGGPRAAAFDGRAASVTGWMLHRDGRSMIEVEPNEAAIVADSSRAAPAPAMQSAGRITLRGEIIDSKCFLGAMKPGEGKTHKDCATLCIRGGIPPMFVTRDRDGKNSYYLLRDPGGGPIDPAMHALIADPIEISGELSKWGELNVLSVRSEDAHRL